jgi:outer membrane protein insertion porin family
MTYAMRTSVLLALLSVFVVSSPGVAQPPPAALPPEDSPPLVRNLEFDFSAQNGESNVPYDTYFYHMRITDNVSAPSEERWVPYTEEIEQMLRDDFGRLWDTGFLDDLSIEVKDNPYPNGVIGKHITFKFEERQRVKIVSFEGSDKLDRTDINKALQETELVIRLDSFLDLTQVRSIEGLLGEMFSANGYEFAKVSHELVDLPSSAKTIQVVFHMEHGPKIQVHKIEFVGNTQIEDGELKGQMKHIRERWFLSWINGRGTYKPALFEEDAEAIQSYYTGQGYIDANVGSPDAEYLDISDDGESRGMRLRIPVDEGERYRVGEVRFDGNEVIPESVLEAIFGQLTPGEFYSQTMVTEAIGIARDVYGSRGYTGLTIYPDLQRRTAPDFAISDEPVGDVGDAGESQGGLENPYAHLQKPTHLEGAPVVDVTFRLEEGEQQVVNRISFAGNENTRDEVIRRELQLVENGVFNTAALKTSIRRLNQLGYFDPLEEDAVDIANTEEDENRVDLKFNLAEANQNQLTFGAGVSQFDGFFGQMSFQTANFLGRGETLRVSVQNGSRLRNINLGYTKPYLFGKNMSGGVNVFSRRIEWIGAYTQESEGLSVTVGKPLALFTRMFVSYSFEKTGVTDVNPFLFGSASDPGSAGAGSINPFFAEVLLLDSGGRRAISKITPSIVFNTVDHPIFPRSGQQYQAALGMAGIGGDTRFLKPTLEGTWYFQHLARTVIGLRTQYQHIVSATPSQLPVFERLWLGGEYSIRGFDIRRVGPTLADIDPDVPEDSFNGRTVIGGNKSFLVNAEYQIIIAQPVRIVMFYDAGQVQNFGDSFTMRDFKTSTGAELRFFVPMLNVPFRVIYSYNLQRDGVFNDNFQPQEKTTFRFAVGSTF